MEARLSHSAKAAIVVIGTELTQGLSQESNSVFLARRLNERGFKVLSAQKIPDDISLIAEAVRVQAGVADVVIITGGLGSTHDDVTREGLAAVLGVPLVKDDRAFRSIKVRMPSGADPDAFMRQAFLPEGTTAIMPDGGTAPGIFARLGGTLIFALPGVPREMAQMLDFVDTELSAHGLSAPPPLMAGARLTGRSEPEVARLIAPVMKAYPEMIFNILAKAEEISLTLFSYEKRDPSGESRLDAAFREIRERLGELVFSDRGESLPEVVGRLLVEKRLTLAVAESLTAGGIGALIAAAPGASRYFKGGVTAYDNGVKEKVLGVDPGVLDKYGAVSAETAEAMAAGVRAIMGSDIGLAVTGIAGPAGGTEAKPVGLVYTGLAMIDSTRAVRSAHSGEREVVQRKTAFRALDILRLNLQGTGNGFNG